MSLLSTPTNIWLPPSGVLARYFGSATGTTTYYYWVQAIYAGGTSVISASALVGTTVNPPTHNQPIEVSWNAMAGAIGYIVYRTTTSTAPTIGTNFMGVVSGNSFLDNGDIAPTTGYVTTNGVFTARAHYDFAVDGGAVSTITPAQSDTIPKGAIIVGGYANATTAGTSGGSATMAVGTSAGSSTSSILSATAVASLSANAVVIATAAATPFKMTAAGAITVTIAAATFTAGVVDVEVMYMMPLS